MDSNSSLDLLELHFFFDVGSSSTPDPAGCKALAAERSNKHEPSRLRSCMQTFSTTYCSNACILLQSTEYSVLDTNRDWESTHTRLLWRPARYVRNFLPQGDAVKRVCKPGKFSGTITVNSAELCTLCERKAKHMMQNSSGIHTLMHGKNNRYVGV